ncbi:MAG: hypothetical protein R3E87_09850 [Burkholderiaceae bacterium]
MIAQTRSDDEDDDGWRARLAHDLRQPLQAVALLAREAAQRSGSGDDGLHVRLVEAADELSARIAGILSTPRRPGQTAPARAQARHPEPVAGEPERPGARVAPDRPARALIVDAHAAPRQALADALGLLGLQVGQAGSSREAVAALVVTDEPIPDCILINLRHQGEPILPALMSLGHASRSRVPIVVMTGELLPTGHAHGEPGWRELGVVAVVPRPRTLSALRETLALAA